MNSVPNDPTPKTITSGVRIGTAAVTTRGLVEDDMRQIAHCVALTAKDFDCTREEVLSTVANLCEKYPMYRD